MIEQISVKQLQEKIKQGNSGFVLLDVREKNEFEYASIAGSIWIPMGEVPRRVKELSTDDEMAILCHHGVRSMQVAEYLQSKGFKHLLNVQGGIDAWSCHCDSEVPRY